ncbi:Hypothetical protein A7982_03582 [Minicystis rosea]|nr:Hypothetical protein A7982_03582 [Minicystis rosea]
MRNRARHLMSRRRPNKMSPRRSVSQWGLARMDVTSDVAMGARGARDGDMPCREEKS